MIRSCTRSALILIACALYLRRLKGVKTIFVLPVGWHESVVRVVNLLAYWEDEASDLRGIRCVVEKGLEQATSEGDDLGSYST